MVIREALEYGFKNLSNNLYTDPLNESRRILSFLMNKDSSYILTYPEVELGEEISNKFIEIIDRRKNGEPIQYIFNSADFYGRDFYVDNRVLIPRWDTENLIEKVIELAKDFAAPKILEIGSGSGAISTTLGLEIKNAQIESVDISKDALDVSNINLERYKVENVRFSHSNLFENLVDKYDIIVSNPPYIKKADLKNLQLEVKNEPVLALDGGEDGLDFYRKITKESIDYLKENGYLVYEIGHDQYEDVKEILEANGFKNIDGKKDLQGINRVIYGQRR